MIKLCRVTKIKVLFLVLVYVFNFNFFEFSAAILEKGLLRKTLEKKKKYLLPHNCSHHQTTTLVTKHVCNYRKRGLRNAPMNSFFFNFLRRPMIIDGI